MPTLFEQIFSGKVDEDIPKKRLLLQDIIERGLRVGRGEKFDEPLTGVTPLFGRETGAPPEQIEFDKPGRLEGEDTLKSFFKGLVTASERGMRRFKAGIGLDDMSDLAPQEKFIPRFGENIDPTLLERGAELVGEFAPQLAGGIFAPGFIPASLAGATEEVIAGGSKQDILFSALGGGIGGVLGKIGARLAKEGIQPGRILAISEELAGMARAVDTGVEHVVTRPDFDLFPEVPLSEFQRILDKTIRAQARGAADVPIERLDEFVFTTPAPRVGPRASLTEVLGRHITKQADELGIPQDQAFNQFTQTVLLPETPEVTSKLVSGQMKLPENAKELLALREMQIMEFARRSQQGIESTSPLAKASTLFPKNNPILLQADTIISRHLDGLFEPLGKKEARGITRGLMKSLTNNGRLKLGMEIEKGKFGPLVPRESLSAAKNVVKKSFGPELTAKEIDATVEAMDPDVIFKLARQYDSSSARATDSLTKSVCESIARSGK